MSSHHVFFRSDSNNPTPAEWVSACMMIAKQRFQSRDDARVWEMVGNRVANAQVFDFAVVDDICLREEAKRGGNLWGLGHLDVPYRSGIYRYKNIPDPKILREFMEGKGVHDAELQAELRKIPEYSTIFAKTDNGYLFGADFVRADEIRGDSKTCFALAAACIGRADPQNPKLWQGWAISPELCITSTEGRMMIGSVMDGIVGLSMMLQTRNIKIRTEVPSPKLNKKRVESGKTPLPTVTHVNASHYFEAMKNTAQKGTHASPVPHLRRGHVRHYENGHTIWIKDTIVNARSVSELQRDHYEVKV